MPSRPSFEGAPRLRVALEAVSGRFPVAVDLDLPGAAVTAIFGPSGAGKTTLLRMLAGLDRVRGSVHVGDTCWQDDARGVFVPVHRRGVGYVVQDHALFAHLTVAGNLDFGRARASRSAAPNAGAGALDRALVVDRLGLGALLDRRPATLSGGERQRVAIAQALLGRPRVVLMDEPLASLDDARKAEVLACLLELRGALAIPIIYVSHALDEIARLADHLVLLDAGRVVASGPLHEMLARIDLATASADDAGVVIEAAVASHDAPNLLTEIAFEGGTLWVAGMTGAIGARVRARAHARDVSLALDPPGPSSILNVLRARVTDVKDGGPDRVHVRLTIGEGPVPLLARVTRRSLGALDLRPGLVVYAQIKTVALAW